MEPAGTSFEPAAKLFPLTAGINVCVLEMLIWKESFVCVFVCVWEWGKGCLQLHFVRPSLILFFSLQVTEKTQRNSVKRSAVSQYRSHGCHVCVKGVCLSSNLYTFVRYAAFTIHIFVLSINACSAASLLPHSCCF